MPQNFTLLQRMFGSWPKKLAWSFLILIVFIRIILPPIVLRRLNLYLATFSPIYALHIQDLSISVFRMAYQFENATGIYKKDGQKFFSVESVDVSISWAELLRGRVLTNVDINAGTFVLTKVLFEGAKQPESKTKEKAREAASKLFPVRIAVVEFHNSAFDFADLLKASPATRWHVSEIQGKVLNLNPTPSQPLTFFAAQGTLLDSAKFKIAGHAKRLDKPLGWKVDTEIRDFDLVAANPMLMIELPFSFTKGKLDLYSELRSQHGVMDGYIKPFLKNVTVLPKDNDYKGLQHFAYEIVGAFANVVLRKSSDKTVASRIAFHEEKGEKFKIDTGDAIKSTLKHGFTDQSVKPGLDDSLSLD